MAREARGAGGRAGAIVSADWLRYAEPASFRGDMQSNGFFESLGNILGEIIRSIVSVLRYVLGGIGRAIQPVFRRRGPMPRA